MKMDAVLEINDDDDNETAILPDDGGIGGMDEVDLTIMDMDANDIQEIENVVNAELFPTIASVTSLHPNSVL